MKLTKNYLRSLIKESISSKYVSSFEQNYEERKHFTVSLINKIIGLIEQIDYMPHDMKYLDKYEGRYINRINAYSYDIVRILNERVIIYINQYKHFFDETKLAPENSELENVFKEKFNEKFTEMYDKLENILETIKPLVQADDLKRVIMYINEYIGSIVEEAVSLPGLFTEIDYLYQTIIQYRE